MKNSKMLALIHLIAECHETELSEARASMICTDLSPYSPNEVNTAWSKYRSVPMNTRMPTAAQLIQFIPDGHPSAQESFAMLPKDEYSSVIWTDEMRFAYAVCYAFIRDGNMTAAFFAYREEYDRLVQEVRMSGRKPRWSASFGDDKSGRELAIVQAVEKKRITLDLACKIYPEIEFSTKYEILAINYGGEALKIDHQNREKISKLIESTVKDF